MFQLKNNIPSIKLTYHISPEKWILGRLLSFLGAGVEAYFHVRTAVKKTRGPVYIRQHFSGHGPLVSELAHFTGFPNGAPADLDLVTASGVLKTSKGLGMERTQFFSGRVWPIAMLPIWAKWEKLKTYKADVCGDFIEIDCKQLMAILKVSEVLNLK